MNRIRRIPWIAALAGWLAVIAASGPAPAAEAGAIVPGQSIGSLRLGSPVTALYQAAGWGQPDRVHTSGSISYMTYGRQGIMVAIRDSTVALILTTSERYKTDKGVAVGQGVTAATNAYGVPASGGDDRTLWYDAAGLVVVIGGGVIVRIGVYDPRHFVRAILADEQPARDVFLTARQPKAASGVADARSGQGTRAAVIAVTLRNTSRATKVLNPNFFMLVDRDGDSHRYDRTTFAQKDACKSTLVVRPGESKTCSLVFLVPAGRAVRSIAYNDGGSLDEFYF